MFINLKDHFEKVEEKLRCLEKKDADFGILSARIVSGLDALNDHLKEHIQREFEDGRVHSEKLDSISSKLNSIERDMATVPKDVELKISQSQDELKDFVAGKYSTRTELNAGLNSIRTSARLIWIFIVGATTCIAWAVSALLSYVK